MKKRIIALLVGSTLFLFSSLFGQTGSNLEKIEFGEKPPLHFGTVTNGIAAGMYSGIIIGLGGMCIGQLINTSFDPLKEDPHSLLQYEPLLGSWIGYILGSSMGVYESRTKDNIGGSYLATLIGSIAGGLLLAIPAPIGATIGFNQSRRYKTLAAEKTGFINYKERHVNFAFPVMHYRTHSFDNTAKPSINLVNAEF